MDPRHRNRWMVAFAVFLPIVFTMGCSGDTVQEDSGVECTHDEECGIGEYCHMGVCTPFGGDDGPQICSNDAECPTGEICEDGICTPGYRPDGGQDADAGGDETPPDGGGDQADDQDAPQPRISISGDVTVFEDEFGKTYELNFGNVAAGAPITRSMVIRNLGTADLNVSVLTIEDDPQDEFSVDPAVPPQLAIEPGKEVAIQATYLASDGLTDRAVARLFSNDPLEGEIPIHLISEFKGEVAIHLDPNSLDFGDVPLGQVDTQNVTVSNQGTGNAVLRLDSVVPDASISTAYQVLLKDIDDGSELGLPLYLNRYDSVLAEVSFLAPARGTFQGDIIIESNDPDASPSLVAVSGRAGTPSILIEPAWVDFGQVPTLVWATDREVCVSNQGVGDLLVSSVQFGPTSSTDFSLDPPLPADPPVILAPMDQLTFLVRYFPNEVGVDQASLIIEHDDPDQDALVVDIGGEGIQGNARPTAIVLANGVDTAFANVLLTDRIDLDGQQSFDSDGTLDRYQWRIIDQPAVHPCGQESTLSGTMNPVTFIVLREAGLTQIGLQVQDNNGAWSDEDVLDIQVGAPPEADLRVGNNTTGFLEVDMDEVVVFDGGYSTDCDGIVTEYQWSVVEYPPGRLSPPNISATGHVASVQFDFPGDYRIGLVVLDNDAPKNPSTMSTFDVKVNGPKGFRVTVDWFNRGNSDHHVDVDLHMLKPGSTAFFSPDDCCSYKLGRDEECDPTPDWGDYGIPYYQRDSFEDGDAAEPPDPASPADEISFSNPGLGEYGIYVYFRCHSSAVVAGQYVCCDDLFHCPLELTCLNETCLRRADGTVIVYVTDKNNVETELVRRSFAIDSEQSQIQVQVGTMSWPEGTFQ